MIAFSAEKNAKSESETIVRDYAYKGLMYTLPGKTTLSARGSFRPSERGTSSFVHQHVHQKAFTCLAPAALQSKPFESTPIDEHALQQRHTAASKTESCRVKGTFYFITEFSHTCRPCLIKIFRGYRLENSLGAIFS